MLELRTRAQGTSRLAQSAHLAGGEPCCLPGPGQHLRTSSPRIKTRTALSLDGGSKAKIFVFCFSFWFSQSAISEISALNMCYFIMRRKSINIIFMKGYTIDWKDNLYEMPRGRETPSQSKVFPCYLPRHPRGRNSLSCVLG